MKTILLLDQDGPLADFDRQFFDRCRENGWEMDLDHPHSSRHRFLDDHITDKRHRALARGMVNSDPSWFHTLPVTKGALEGVEALLRLGLFDLWVVTKPLEVNPGCRDGKGAWIRRHFPFLEDRLIIAPDKSMVRGDALIDDAIKPAWIGRATWKPIVFRTGFNGPGSSWGHLPSWHWGDGVDTLCTILGM